jgi:hypothetical protein
MKKIKVIDKYSKSIWKKEEKKFKDLEKRVKIPDEKLSKVDSVILTMKDKKIIEKIPESSGCYWIWTNEPVYHRLHKNEIPKKIKSGEIIYNGITKDNVRQRVKHHLFGEIHAKWSGISMDIYPKKSKSHRKKAMSPSGKVPFICDTNRKKNNDFKPIRSKKLLLKLFLSNEEKILVKTTNYRKVWYFRNGIDFFEKKHNKFKFRVYFITGLSWLYLEYVEKNGESIMDCLNFAHIPPDVKN